MEPGPTALLHSCSEETQLLVLLLSQHGFIWEVEEIQQYTYSISSMQVHTPEPEWAAPTLHTAVGVEKLLMCFSKRTHLTSILESIKLRISSAPKMFSWILKKIGRQFWGCFPCIVQAAEIWERGPQMRWFRLNSTSQPKIVCFEEILYPTVSVFLCNGQKLWVLE